MRSAGRSRRPRRAISPIIATVLIISMTLVASVAIGGMVYGIFSSSDNTAQVGVVGTAIPAAVTLGVTYVVCATGSGNSYAGYIQLYNSGTAATVATALNIVYGGAALQIPLGGSCKIAPDSTLYLDIYALPTFSSTGVPFNGYVSTGNGAEILFTAAFE